MGGQTQAGNPRRELLSEWLSQKTHLLSQQLYRLWSHILVLPQPLVPQGCRGSLQNLPTSPLARPPRFMVSAVLPAVALGAQHWRVPMYMERSANSKTGPSCTC